MALSLVAIACMLQTTSAAILRGASSDSSDTAAPELNLAIVDAPHLNLAIVTHSAHEIAEMEKIFERSDAVHHHSMDEIAKSLTIPKAVEALENSSIFNTSSLNTVKQVASLILGNHSLRSVRVEKLKGFGGLDGARKLLNEMIHETMQKYDTEVAKCTDYYSKQCALMETARSQIAAANYVSATARALILDSQGNINKCEVSIPETKQELEDHNTKCYNERQKLTERLAIVLNDIAVLTTILEMSDCDADKKLMQMDVFSMYRCQDPCTKKKYFTFNQGKLQKRVSQLRSPAAERLFEEAFADLFVQSGAHPVSFLEQQQLPVKLESSSKTSELHPVKLVGKQPGEVPPSNDGELPPLNASKTEFNNPPVPKTEVPGNPCTDPNQGAPSADDKRAAKCTLSTPKCYKLQQRFLQIQGGVADDRDDLMEQIANLDATCKETAGILQASIDNDETLLSSSQTKMATAMEKESNAGEMGRQVSAENDGYNDDLVKTMKTCSNNYVSFETELCALRKIRGDLFKKMKEGHDGFFQDCEVSKWTPEECTKKCAGGEQKLTRSVLSHPGPKESPGSECLPLAAKRSCNHQKCPVNCVLHQWGGWSKCSSKCGGGMSQRVRDVKVAMKYGGTPCGKTTEAKQCNVAACEKDCVLHEWTAWTTCSKDCDGGTQKRMKMVKAAPEGDGKCAEKWSKERLEYKACNARRCRVENATTSTLKCNKTLDVVLVIDGTPKSGEEGFTSEIRAANLLLEAFQGPGINATPNFAIVHYTGPRTWSGVSKCTGKSTGNVDMAKDCHVTIPQHFSTDMEKSKETVNKLEYKVGSKLLSLALMAVKSELPLGRPDARTIVIVFMDGEPLSYRKTLITSKDIRKKARLLYIPVVKFSPLKDIKKWASRRWQENIVSVDEAADWAKPETGTHIIADICPNDFPTLESQPRRSNTEILG